MAGFDTSGHTATWVLFLVSQHPEARPSRQHWAAPGAMCATRGSAVTEASSYHHQAGRRPLALATCELQAACRAPAHLCAAGVTCGILYVMSWPGLQWHACPRACAEAEGRGRLRSRRTAHASAAPGSGLGAQRCRRVQVERRIVEELRGQGLLAEPGRPRPRLPTYDDAEALPFLKAVINVRARPAARTRLRACGVPARAFAMRGALLWSAPARASPVANPSGWPAPCTKSGCKQTALAWRVIWTPAQCRLGCQSGAHAGRPARRRRQCACTRRSARRPRASATTPTSHWTAGGWSSRAARPSACTSTPSRTARPTGRGRASSTRTVSCRRAAPRAGQPPAGGCALGGRGAWRKCVPGVLHCCWQTGRGVALQAGRRHHAQPQALGQTTVHGDPKAVTRTYPARGLSSWRVPQLATQPACEAGLRGAAAAAA